MKKHKLAVCASGSGTNLQAIIDSCEKGVLKNIAEISVVVSNNPASYALKRAFNHNIDTVVVDHKKWKQTYKEKTGSVKGWRASFEKKISSEIEQFDPDLIVLAGYMLLLTPDFINRWYNYEKDLPGIVNIHPALLPAFKGIDGYGDAFRYGVKYGGITVHFVDAGMDSGPIIMQKPVPILETDTLEEFKARGLAIEHEIYPEAVKLYCTDALELKDRKVIVKK